MRNIYRIALVEDEAVHLNALKDMLNRYSAEKDVIFGISTYTNVENFISAYKNPFDIVFMDIELPGMNGMEGAKKLRALDSVVTIIFVTNMAQFAVQGYEVDALDYIIKPVGYKNFSVKLDRALGIVGRSEHKHVVVCGKDEMHRMDIRNIMYVEVRGHHLIFHKTDGEDVEVCGSLSGLADELGGYGYARCSSCYLCNMRYISKITGLTVVLSDGTELQISRRKRKEFVDEVTVYVGNSGGGT